MPEIVQHGIHYFVVVEGIAPVHYYLLLGFVFEFRRSVILLRVLFPQDQLRKSVEIKRMRCDSLFLQTSMADFTQDLSIV